MRHINTNSDTELLLNTFAEELQRKRLRKISPDEIFDTVRSVMRRLLLSYFYLYISSYFYFLFIFCFIFYFILFYFI